MNTIWYRFYSEKDSYPIHFDTTGMSIQDIRKEIINRRNMFKFPEKFNLLFYDEENNSLITEDKDLIKPMKHLIIKRFPFYKGEPNFVPIVREPHGISMNKTNENNLRRVEPQKIVRYTEPLEKIMKKLNEDIIKKQFGCKLCHEKLLDAVIFKCCKETFCINCYSKDGDICPNCKQTKIGYIKNDAENKLVKKLLEILEKKEELEKIQREKILQQEKNLMSINANGGTNQRNIINNTTNPNSDNIKDRYNYSGNIAEKLTINQNIEPSDLSNLNPSISLIEGSQFFIIKSYNKENIEKSRKHSVWATTISNSNKLNEAFKKGNVILIFSVNCSQSYKGYAIMTSCTADSPSNNWQIENNIKLGGDFSVVWLCYCELNSSKAKHLQNAKKNNDPVNKSRDCTELSYSCGYELCKLCFEQEKIDLENNRQHIRVYINKQLIDKINEDIKNNRNKQIKKNNKLLNNNEKNENNKTNENPNTTNMNNPIQLQIPQIPTPIMPINLSYYNWLLMMQMRNQDPNNQNPMIPAALNNQQQSKQDNDNNDKGKKGKENDSKSKNYHKKYHRKDRERRNKSRDSRSRSKSRNRSRSSRYSNSDSSRSEGRSKYSKSYK